MLQQPLKLRARVVTVAGPREAHRRGQPGLQRRRVSRPRFVGERGAQDVIRRAGMLRR
jgi:hypothetical protein